MSANPSNEALNHDSVLRFNETRSFKKLWGGRREQMLVKEIANQMPRSTGRLLDVGCGDGYLLDCLSRTFSYSLHGCDVSETRLKRTMANVPAATLCYHDYTVKPLEEEAFDVVICSETLEHIDLIDQACENLSRTVRSGGRLIVTVPNEEDLEQGRYTCPTCKCRFHRSGHVQSFTARRLADLFDSHFDILRVRAFGRPAGIRGAIWRFRGGKLPHLLYVGRKK